MTASGARTRGDGDTADPRSLDTRTSDGATATPDQEQVEQPTGRTQRPAERYDEPRDRRGPDEGPADRRPGKPRPVRTSRRLLTHPSTVAVAVWLVTVPLAFLVPAVAHPNPFQPRGVILPLAAGGCVAFVLAALAWWYRRQEVSGAAAGLFASWVALTLETALSGTPFGFAGLLGDMGRISAGATTYGTTAASTDAIVKALPAEYPPLYTWLIGRAAAVLDIPAWRLVAEAEVLTTSAAVLVAFLLWRRLVPVPVAVAIAVAGLVAFGDPRKAFEVLTAAAFAPWAIMTFGLPPRGRFRGLAGTLAGGIIGGLMVLTYQGFLIYGAFGLLTLLVLTWWRAADRRGYLRHVVLVMVVAAVTAGWYVVPYLVTLWRTGGQQTADLYPSDLLSDNPLPFLEPTLLGALQLTGLVGLLWYRRSAWWANPLLVLVAGTYAYQVLMMVRFVLSGHTGFFHYTLRLIGPLLAAAGVLAVVQAVPGLLRRFSAVRPVPPGRPAAPVTPVRPRAVLAGGLAIVLLWGGLEYWRAALPQHLSDVLARREPDPFYTVRAHTEPLPGGRRPRYAPADPRVRPLPVTRIRRSVAGALGPDARPITLSYDERLFAYLPWPGYVGVGRMSANTLAHWDARAAEVARLARISEPAEFARAARHTRFGPIEAFVLRRRGADWRWKNTRFWPGQFADPWFARTELPDGTIVAVARPERPGDPKRPAETRQEIR